MTSINHFFTMNYDQPSGYHFSHDSVFFARKVFELVVSQKLPTTHILDLCSGCGIIGLDFLFHLTKNKLEIPRQADFVEVQDIYIPYFERNVNRLDCSTSCHFLNLNYIDLQEDLSLKNKYDLIVCNPPYFRKELGRLSPSEFKNRCRFYLDADFQNLFQSIKYVLSETGTAYVLIKSLKKHGIDIESELQVWKKDLLIKKIDTVRSTDLFEIKKI